MKPDGDGDDNDDDDWCSFVQRQIEQILFKMAGNVVQKMRCMHGATMRWVNADWVTVRAQSAFRRKCRLCTACESIRSQPVHRTVSRGRLCPLIGNFINLTWKCRLCVNCKLNLSCLFYRNFILLCFGNITLWRVSMILEVGYSFQFLVILKQIFIWYENPLQLR